MNVGKRFDIALEEVLGYKRNSTAIANEYEVTTQAISQLKKNEKSNDLMKKIAKDKGISLSWLEFGEGNMLEKDSKDNFVEDSGTLYNKEDQVVIPYHKDVHASAGGDAENHDMTHTSPISFSKDFLNTFLGIYNFKGLSIINAAGDSMDPTIKSGELMFVSPMKNEEFKDGGVYVLMCGNVLLVKRVTYDPFSKEYTLVSDNGRVSPVTLTIDEGSDCYFIGRVVGHLDRV